jgi:protein-disulfide isomerase
MVRTGLRSALLPAFLVLLGLALNAFGDDAAGKTARSTDGTGGLEDEYRKLLEIAKSRNRPTKAVEGELDIAAGPAIGSANAPVVLVEFSDYQCPFCRRHLEQTADQLRTEWVATGKLLYVFQDYPLVTKHPNAARAAEAAWCAHEQDQYWEMRQVLYGAQKALHETFLPAHAVQAGLDAPAFSECLESGRYRDAVADSLARGKAMGIRATPVFFLGLNTGEGRVKLMRRITGALPYDTFHQELQSLLDMADATGNTNPKPAADRRITGTDSGLETLPTN